MTHRPAAPAPARARRADARVPRALAVTFLATPAMLLAQLVTTRTVPAPGVVALVAATVFGLTAALGLTAATTAGCRWRLAVTVGLAQLAGHALLALLHPVSGPASGGGCLPIVGRGAQVGLRLALLREDAACPQGALAPGPTATGSLAALLSAALVLLVHSLVAVVAAALVTATELAVRAVRACAALVGVRPTRSAVPVAAPRQMLAAPATGRPVRPAFRPRPVPRRGPPVAAAAA